MVSDVSGRLQTGDENLFDIPECPASLINCEAILRWPIFQGCAPDIQSFVLDFVDDDSERQHDSWSGISSGGVREEDFIPLAKRFLAFVHVKNPILDCAEFMSYVRDVAENGIRWDGQSCLVVSWSSFPQTAAPEKKLTFDIAHCLCSRLPCGSFPASAANSGSENLYIEDRSRYGTSLLPGCEKTAWTNRAVFAVDSVPLFLWRSGDVPDEAAEGVVLLQPSLHTVPEPVMEKNAQTRRLRRLHVAKNPPPRAASLLVVHEV